MVEHWSEKPGVASSILALAILGPVAQLGERRNGIAKAAGAEPARSISFYVYINWLWKP